MKEIGSEFWNVPVAQKNNGLFNDSVQWYVSGRSALTAIINNLHNCKTVSMPSWCCDSMIKPFIDAGLEVRFYPVYWDNGLIKDISFNSDVLFLMDYFGYSGVEPNLSKYDGIVIRDVTHSLLSVIPNDADYYFGSLRKWCGILTGGFAWSKDCHLLNCGDPCDVKYIGLREEAMRLKREYITGSKEVIDKEYLKIFCEAENLLDSFGVMSSCERDIKIADYLDTDYVIKQRKKNSSILRKAFPEWVVFKEEMEDECPLFVPILVPKKRRDELRRFLTSKDIYCPIHWPVSEYHKLDCTTRYIYESELSLICDQRYDEKDMQKIVDTIRLFWKEN